MTEDDFIIETAQQKLERLGQMEVVSSASVQGTTPVMLIHYATSIYKQQERFDITQESPRDSGQGYQFTNTSHTEV